MLAKVVFAHLLPYIVGIAGISAIVYMIDDRAFKSGVRKTTDLYEEAMSTERKRLQGVNDEALREARIRERELRNQLRERNAEIVRILEESKNDPDADRRAIGTDSVSRINRVR